jgi:hypothetical protein
MLSRLPDLAAILRQLADALETASRENVQTDAQAVAALVADVAAAWMTGSSQ